MDEEQEERREIEAYLDQHQLQAFIGDAVNDIVKERPTDPLVKLADALRACSDASRQIQKVHGRQILNGEALPALEVEVRTGQGPVYCAVSFGPHDGVEEDYEGRGLRQAVESVDQILAEVLVGKDPTRQEKLDRLLTQEPSLYTNVVSAASIACCKAGAKQTPVSVFDHIGTMCNNSEGEIPALAFSVINGGYLSASSLWVQDVFVVPTGDNITLPDQLLATSKVHRTLETAARDAGQETLRRGPRGGFCNGAGTFEHMMGCLMAAIETAGISGSVEVIVDVHASKLVPPPKAGEAPGEGQQTSYDLGTFAPDRTGVELTTAQTLLDTYLEWLEKYPITAFIEPFAAADVATSKELLVRGHQARQAKIASSNAELGDPTAMAGSGEGHPPKAGQAANVEASGGEGKCLIRVIADESVSTPAQLAFVNEHGGANAVVINLAKISTITDCITLASRASELGWAIAVAAVSEQELEGEFLADLGVGLRAEQLLLGGLRLGTTISACSRLARIEDEGILHAGAGQE